VTIKFVERKVSEYAEARQALLETIKNGKAAVLPLNGAPASTLQQVLRSWLKHRGYILHYRQSDDGKDIIAWAEKEGK
jgi:hypothetical protein